MEFAILMLISAAWAVILSPEIQNWILEKVDEFFDDDNWPTGGRSVVTP